MSGRWHRGSKLVIPCLPILTKMIDVMSSASHAVFGSELLANCIHDLAESIATSKHSSLVAFASAARSLRASSRRCSACWLNAYPNDHSTSLPSTRKQNVMSRDSGAKPNPSRSKLTIYTLSRHLCGNTSARVYICASCWISERSSCQLLEHSPSRASCSSWILGVGHERFRASCAFFDGWERTRRLSREK